MKIKKFSLVLLLTGVLFGLCACGGNSEKKTEAQTENAGKELPTVLNSAEYVLYQNIFVNDAGKDYIGDTISKTGTFASLQDSYNQKTRYYVWGYNDQTKCCDWQWEFVPKDPDSLPPSGSLVEMEGVFAASEEALDGYWFEDASVTVKTEYTGPACDIDMTCMSDTLERVQMLNMQNFTEEYEGKTVYGYGRVASPTSIEDPYYDGSWNQAFSSENTIPAIGTMVIVSGVYHDGVIAESDITPSEQY